MVQYVRYFSAAVFGSSVCMSTMAQEIFGTVNDKDGAPLEFVNVALYNPSDTTLVQGTVTDKEGGFIFHNCNPQIYLLRASMVGFATIEQLVDKDRVGTLILSEDSKLLDEVTVKVNRPQYKMTGEGISVNVKNSVLSNMGSAIDVLSQLPRVNVEGDAVSVFAKGTPLIYINNRLVRDKSELKRLKSDEIKDVEVLTNPGAKYDAQVESVIRINTLKVAGDGFSFRTENNARTNYDMAGGYTEEYVKYRKKGFEMFGTGQFNSGIFREDQTLVTDIYAQDHVRVDGVDDVKARVNSLNFNAGFNYDFNTRHSIGADYSYGTITHFDAKSTCLTQKVYRNGVFEDFLDEEMIQSEKPHNHDVNAYYVGKIGKWSVDANFSYHFGKSSESEQTTEISQTADSRVVNTVSQSTGKLWAGKIILTYPIWKGKLSFGHEITSSNTMYDYSNLQHIVASANNEIKESNAAVFAEYGFAIGDWRLNAGLRYEHVTSDYYAENIWQKAQSRNYDNFFPNASVSWRKNGTGLQLSYTCKTSRPDYSRLSNKVKYDNRYLYEGGNPYLQPSVSQNVEFSAIRPWWNVSLGYSHIKDGFQYILGLYKDQPIAFGVYRNFNAADKLHASIVLSPKFGWYQPQLELGYIQQFIDAKQYNVEKDMNRAGFKVKVKNRMVFPHDLSILLNLNYMTDQYHWLVHQKAAFVADARIVKSFWNKALTLNLSANDLFHTWRQKVDIWGNHVNIGKNNDQHLSDISLTVTYQFNTTRSRYKGTGAGKAEKDRM
ncbi:MAG: outer membrane beta-barrel protein [Bacteroidales bacterium]|nr:outer membrane beta-barrel protein [Bacteroidales bacterium]